MGQSDWAIRAFSVALEQNPNNPFPHRCLAQLYERAKNNRAKAEHHRQMARVLADGLKRSPPQSNPAGEEA